MLLESPNFYSELLREHLRVPFLAAFAYGSGVFSQEGQQDGSKGTGKMIDYLVIVDDTKSSDSLCKWHLTNMHQVPQDYPSIFKHLLKITCGSSQICFPPPHSIIYFPNVQTEGRIIKYGVLGWSTFQRDLFTWESIFLPGRLHKPTLLLAAEQDGDDGVSALIKSALKHNYLMAVKVALLLHSGPVAPSLSETLQKIIGLSYTGDPRMRLAESPHKLKNIYSSQKTDLEAIYESDWQALLKSGLWNDPGYRHHLLTGLPPAILSRLPTDPWTFSVKFNHQKQAFHLERILARIVCRGAWKQMLLSLLATSPLNASAYVWSKMKKRMFV